MEGYCRCGCGTPTERFSRSDSAQGQVKGEYKRWIFGHFGKSPDHWTEVDCGYETPCWNWRHAGGVGYGTMSKNGRTVNAHRVYYEALIGPVPDGLELDHLCRNRRCVNPFHLEPVTRAENIRRGARHNKKLAA